MRRKVITDALELVAVLAVAVACVLAGAALRLVVGLPAGLALGLVAGAVWLFGSSALIARGGGS